MSKIITISREFGSGGHFIGENVAKKLGITFYDSQILEKIAEETGFSKKIIEDQVNIPHQRAYFPMHLWEEMRQEVQFRTKYITHSQK